MENQENKPYQLTCLFDPSAKTERTDQIIEGVKKIITENEGVISENNYSSAPIRKKLAYSMKKQTEALYWDFNFSILPEKIKKLDHFLKFEKDLIRYFIANKKKLKPRSIKKSAELKMIDKIEPLLDRVLTKPVKKEKTKEEDIKKEIIKEKIEKQELKDIKEKTKIEDLDKKLEEILNQ